MNMPPNTELCYAMKANSENLVLEHINKKGGSFEVASKYELAMLKKINIPPRRITYGTSIKPIDHIKAFVKYGVDRFAFDSEQELEKLAKHAPGSRVYVRTLVDDRSDSVFHMSLKFGVKPINVVDLLIKAKEMGLQPYGISFNVGSQARNVASWARGINDVAKIMENLLERGIKIACINIGGGFPVNYDQNDKFPTVKKIGEEISQALKNVPYKVNIIAEPGRAVVADSFLLVSSVIEKNTRSNGTWLYIDAGIYNALYEAVAVQGSTKYKIAPISNLNHKRKYKNYILTGPTGDNIDVINPSVSLPENIKPGDKLAIYNVGAYTFPLTTRFNGFPKPLIKVLDH